MAPTAATDGCRPTNRAGRRWCRCGQNRRQQRRVRLFPKRTRVKAGTAITFTNAGDTPHTATSFDNGKIGAWDTGVLNLGELKTITFDRPGNYYYICTPHPWMYGQIIVE
jgi:plastocyanin